MSLSDRNVLRRRRGTCLYAAADGQLGNIGLAEIHRITRKTTSRLMDFSMVANSQKSKSQIAGQMPKMAFDPRINSKTGAWRYRAARSFWRRRMTASFARICRRGSSFALRWRKGTGNARRWNS
jgi:hypothetical protein